LDSQSESLTFFVRPRPSRRKGNWAALPFITSHLFLSMSYFLLRMPNGGVHFHAPRRAVVECKLAKRYPDRHFINPVINVGLCPGMKQIPGPNPKKKDLLLLLNEIGFPKYLIGQSRTNAQKVALIMEWLRQGEAVGIR
jgi:hypothetical protein